MACLLYIVFFIVMTVLCGPSFIFATLAVGLIWWYILQIR